MLKWLICVFITGHDFDMKMTRKYNLWEYNNITDTPDIVRPQAWCKRCNKYRTL